MIRVGWPYFVKISVPEAVGTSAEAELPKWVGDLDTCSHGEMPLKRWCGSWFDSRLISVPDSGNWLRLTRCGFFEKTYLVVVKEEKNGCSCGVLLVIPLEIDKCPKAKTTETILLLHRRSTAEVVENSTRKYAAEVRSHYHSIYNVRLNFNTRETRVH